MIVCHIFDKYTTININLIKKLKIHKIKPHLCIRPINNQRFVEAYRIISNPFNQHLTNKITEQVIKLLLTSRYHNVRIAHCVYTAPGTVASSSIPVLRQPCGTQCTCPLFTDRSVSVKWLRGGEWCTMRPSRFDGNPFFSAPIE